MFFAVSLLLDLLLVQQTLELQGVDLPGCGVSRTTTRPASERIYGGTEVAVGQFPWLAVVGGLHSDGQTFRGYCTASVITSNWLLLTGDCCSFGDLQSLAVYVGDVGWSRPHVATGTRFGVENRTSLYILSGEVYDYDQAPNDICLVRTNQTKDTNSLLINGICLPEPDTRFNINDSFVLAGFGSRSLDAADVSTKAQRIDHDTIITHSRCKEVTDDILTRNGRSYSNTHEAPFLENLSDNLFCQQPKPGRGPCMGDTGTPLMVQRNGKWMLVGFGVIGILPNIEIADYRCGILNVYSNVSAHLNWIYETITERELTTTVRPQTGAPPPQDFTWIFVIGLLLAFLLQVSFVWFCLIHRRKARGH